LEEYSELSRSGASLSGIRFADQRGVILCSQGVRVCQYNQFFDHEGLNGWQELKEGVDHFCFFIDGPFELVTNRNLPAQKATTLLKRNEFVKYVADFLTRVGRESGGDVLQELRNRIRREATVLKENEYVRKTHELKERVADRGEFRVEIPEVSAISE